MSDYLNNLAARVLNLTEVICPRPVSLFEPPPLPGWPWSDHSPDLSGVEDEHASGETEFDTLPPPRRLTGRPPVSLQPVTSLSPPLNRGQQQLGESSSMRTWRAGQSTGHPSSPWMPAESQPANRSTSEQLGQPVAVSPSVEPAPNGERPTGRQPLQPRENSQPVELDPLVQPITPQQFAKNGPQHPVLERPRSPLASTSHKTEAPSSQGVTKGKQQPALEPLIREIVVERMISPEVSPAGDATRVRTEGQPSLKTAEGENQTVIEQAIPRPELYPVAETRARVVAQPHVTRYVEPAGPVPTQPVARPEPTPTIQVTIGRVEVRATPPPVPPSKKERPKPPVMSLDEYLSRRASGGDR